MEIVLAIGIGALVAAGVYLLLRPRTFSVVLGYTLLSYAVNIFLFASGGVRGSQPPVIIDGVRDYADPLPQALVLTAIVIGLGMTAFLIVLSLRANAELKSDHVDGKEDA